MNEPEQTIEAKTGTLKIYSDKIRIERNGIRGLLLHGPTEKEIYAENISSINTTSPPQAMLEVEENGEISNESGGIFFGPASESSLNFSSAEKHRKAKEAIQKLLSKQRTDSTTEQSPKERLQELEELREDGLLSEDEYQSKRSEIVDEL